MKLTLTIEGSVAAIAAVLAKLDDNVVVSTHPELPFADVVVSPTQPIPMPVAHVEHNGEYEAQDDFDDSSAPVDVGAPDVDSKGMPWDARIHASSKATVADGTWRMRRGVDKSIIDVVEAELKGTALVSVPATTLTPMPMQMPIPTETAEPAPMPMPIVEQPVQMPVQTPIAAIEMSAATPSPAVAFPDFMMKLSQNMAGDTPLVTPEYLITVVQRVNLAFTTEFKAITDLGAHPDKLSWAVALMTGEGRW